MRVNFGEGDAGAAILDHVIGFDVETLINIFLDRCFEIGEGCWHDVG